MEAVWFWILAGMLTVYAVLDGFDFGAGIVYLAVAKTDEERRTVLGAIGPLWDGNEVWLLAAGGVLVFAFPLVYAAAFSGLYLALIIVLWLLLLRGISIEFRSKVANPLWRAGWDAVFAFASPAMAVVLGVAIGNLVRGVPLDATGYFHEDLFAGLGGAHGGAIDPFTSCSASSVCARSVPMARRSSSGRRPASSTAAAARWREGCGKRHSRSR